MRWFIFVLICVGNLFAQPNGPFELVSVQAPDELADAKVFFVNDSVAGVCYAEGTGTNWVLKTVTANVSTGEIVSGPTTILETESGNLRVDDAAVDASGEPIALVVNTQGVNHHLQLVQHLNDAWIATTLYTVADYFAWPCGMMYADLQGSQFVATDGEVVQVITNEVGMSCPGFPEPYSQPVACFYETPENFSAVGVYGAGNFAWSPAPRGFEITPDSMHVWIDGTARFAVNRNGEYELLQYYDCPYGDLAGMTVSNGDQIHVSSMNLCIPPCFTLQRFGADSCFVIGEFHTFLGTTPSASIYENHGFIIPTFDELHVELARVDTAANLAASIGTIGWRDGEVSILGVASGVSPFGTIAVVWRDRSNEDSRYRLWLASCDWLTPLDSRDEPAPIPQSISLTAYPNPFNSTVQIEYELPRAGDVELSIHNTLGQQVATLFNGRAAAGTHTLNWSPVAASGIYFVKLQSGDFVTSRKILYVR